eukprot:2342281-Prymnesium_polylepis.1
MAADNSARECRATTLGSRGERRLASTVMVLRVPRVGGGWSCLGVRALVPPELSVGLQNFWSTTTSDVDVKEEVCR